MNFRRPPWLDGLTQFLLAEAENPLPASSQMISRMIDLLGIRVLRSWAAAQPAASGWLGGMAHPRIGRAMCAIHPKIRNNSANEIVRGYQSSSY